MITRLYSAVPMGDNPNQSFDLTWPELGIYFFLRKTAQASTINRLSDCGYVVPRETIVLAINALIDKGLVTEQMVEEVTA